MAGVGVSVPTKGPKEAPACRTSRPHPVPHRVVDGFVTSRHVRMARRGRPSLIAPFYGMENFRASDLSAGPNVNFCADFPL
jgi:hypothetical protein